MLCHQYLACDWLSDSPSSPVYDLYSPCNNNNKESKLLLLCIIVRQLVVYHKILHSYVVSLS